MARQITSKVKLLAIVLSLMKLIFLVYCRGIYIFKILYGVCINFKCNSSARKFILPSRNFFMFYFVKFETDEWYAGISNFEADTGFPIQQGADVESFDDTFFEDVAIDDTPCANQGLENRCDRGFDNTNVVLLEVKNGKSFKFSSGVLLQNPDTWGRPGKRNYLETIHGYRFVHQTLVVKVTLLHC
eukprot:UN23107